MAGGGIHPHLGHGNAGLAGLQGVGNGPVVALLLILGVAVLVNGLLHHGVLDERAVGIILGQIGKGMGQILCRPLVVSGGQLLAFLAHFRIVMGGAQGNAIYFGLAVHQLKGNGGGPQALGVVVVHPHLGHGNLSGAGEGIGEVVVAVVGLGEEVAAGEAGDLHFHDGVRNGVAVGVGAISHVAHGSAVQGVLGQVGKADAAVLQAQYHGLAGGLIVGIQLEGSLDVLIAGQSSGLPGLGAGDGDGFVLGDGVCDGKLVAAIGHGGVVAVAVDGKGAIVGDLLAVNDLHHGVGDGLARVVVSVHGAKAGAPVVGAVQGNGSHRLGAVLHQLGGNVLPVGLGTHPVLFHRVGNLLGAGVGQGKAQALALLAVDQLPALHRLLVNSISNGLAGGHIHGGHGDRAGPAACFVEDDGLFHHSLAGLVGAGHVHSDHHVVGRLAAQPALVDGQFLILGVQLIVDRKAVQLYRRSAAVGYGHFAPGHGDGVLLRLALVIAGGDGLGHGVAVAGGDVGKGYGIVDGRGSLDHGGPVALTAGAVGGVGQGKGGHVLQFTGTGGGGVAELGVGVILVRLSEGEAAAVHAHLGHVEGCFQHIILRGRRLFAHVIGQGSGIVGVVDGLTGGHGVTNIVHLDLVGQSILIGAVGLLYAGLVPHLPQEGSAVVGNLYVLLIAPDKALKGHIVAHGVGNFPDAYIRDYFI